MSDYLPYEGELKRKFNELPLPDEDTLWEDMRRRLEKDKDDKPLIPPVFKSCGCLIIALILLSIGLLLIIDPMKWFHHNIKNRNIKIVNIENQSQVINSTRNHTKNSSRNDTTANTKSLHDSLSNQKRNTTSTIVSNISGKKKGKASEKKSKEANGKTQKAYISINQQNDKKINHLDQPVTNARARNYNHQAVKNISKKSYTNKPENIKPDTVVNAVENEKQNRGLQPDYKNKNVSDTISATKPSVDLIKKKTADSTAHKKETQQEPVKKRNIFFSGGLGLHQLLPVAGQKGNPYNALGRKSSLADYVPSVFLRMYKDKKWFFQSEFRYGAPQYTKEILFAQSKIVDTSFTISTSTGSTVKKTFYHQLPVSFNINLLPGFSVGSGIVFNKFSSAVVQREIHKNNLMLQTDSLISYAIVSQKKADSNFVKSYLQALVETQYQSKRITAGVRYSFGLQPYLKFKLPGGEQRQEKNSSLQLFIRYEFWRSKKSRTED